MKKSYGLYVGKYRPKQFGYGEFYTGKANSQNQAINLIQATSKVGDTILLKDGLKVVKRGKVVDSGVRNQITGRKIKVIKWNN